MDTKGLKNVWLINTADCRGRESAWAEIEAAYSSSGRHYHTLQHLCEVYEELAIYYQGHIPLPSFFALFYHDMVYSPLRGDNEKQSAKYACKKINTWNIEPRTAEKVCHIILATATHQSTDAETMILVDADMAILGCDENKYVTYAAHVRREFSIYPDLLYNRGRRKFIETTLKKDVIFLTSWFREKYETQARINLANELKSLS